MNFLLLDPAEVDGGGRALLRGRRAEHLRTVLKAEPGQVLRAGLLDGPLGLAKVLAVTAVGDVEVQTEWQAQPSPTHDVLLLAVPRPKVLLRLFEHASALGFRRVVLFRSWRVEKSHLQSTAMRPEVQREHLLAGLEQSGRTVLPEVLFFPAFKPMVEDHLGGLGLPATRFVAHPAAAVRTHELAPLAGAPFALAIGPDGGFLPYEIDRLAALGFLPVSCGSHALRTETAVAVLAGQLALLRARATFVS